LIIVNSTFGERIEGDTWRSNFNLTSDRVLADLNDVIIVQTENINTSDTEQTEHNHREDNNSVETAAAMNTRSGVNRRVKARPSQHGRGEGRCMREECGGSKQV